MLCVGSCYDDTDDAHLYMLCVYQELIVDFFTFLKTSFEILNKNNDNNNKMRHMKYLQ